MKPPIEDSVMCTGQNVWFLGSLYVCELVVDIPNDAMISWEADGNTYCDSARNLFHHAGTSAAVCSIGGTFVKVKAWRRGMQLESDTIKFVNRISSIPTLRLSSPGHWVRYGNHCLLIKRMEIADTVAQFCKTLALSTSQTLMTANGHGALETFLVDLPQASEPSWKPRTLGPFSSSQLRSYLSNPTVLKDHIKSFHFYHADLGPTNIIVTEDGSIVGIIDWESAAFYPKFWLGTKPLVSTRFFLRGAEKKA
ncbi:hypothetical protein EJ02DRAFT_473950 [Clathrospora elynae]|uniref:Uncharacterized protein n=1 Tax=Clathrospora elynae TaxID=706981 RepID=A0A6A5SCP3_9PLEO|nr:hypothetical protein EJ02DRAFT_473950 [Clathrospora elynae]